MGSQVAAFPSGHPALRDLDVNRRQRRSTTLRSSMNRRTVAEHPRTAFGRSIPGVSFSPALPPVSALQRKASKHGGWEYTCGYSDLGATCVVSRSRCY